jgi:hypothetical protein
VCYEAYRASKMTGPDPEEPEEFGELSPGEQEHWRAAADGVLVFHEMRP